MSVTDAAKMHAVLLLTCRTASRDSLKTSEKFNIVFLAPSDSDSTQMF